MDAARLAVNAVSILAAHLPELADDAVRAKTDAALGALYDIVGKRLAADGATAAFVDFTKDPDNGRQVGRLLSNAIAADPNYRARLAAAVARAEGDDRSRTSVSQRVSGGTVGNMIGRDNNVDNSVRRTNNTGGIFVTVVVLAVIALVAYVLYLGGRAAYRAISQGLSAGSTCAQFLDADQDTEQRAIVKIAASENVGGAGSPLALPAIRYDCSSEPDAKLGAVIAKFRGQF
ncbi:hypothetical protein [Actinoallomurus sp. CA-150999]|uniref:hypothetical protein n=1 Tax=Actinoallomurus sp. CA-150999 TaxID=3239887 RepID=UPI003D8D4370